MLDNIIVESKELKAALRVLSKNMRHQLGDVWDAVRINVGSHHTDSFLRPHLYLTAAVKDHEAAFMEINIPCEDYDIDPNKSFLVIVSISALKRAVSAISNKERVFLYFHRDNAGIVQCVVLMDKAGNCHQFERQKISNYYSDHADEIKRPYLNEAERKFAGWMRLPYDDFFSAIEKTRRFISQEDTRYYLNGLYVHNGEQIHFCSTDGHRLSHVVVANGQTQKERAKAIGNDHEDGVIIPRFIVDKAYDAMKNRSFRKGKSKPSAFLFERYYAKKDESEENHWKASEGYRTRCQIHCDNWKILFHPIPQKFSDYGSTVLADKNDPKDSIQFNRKEFRDSVSRMLKTDKEAMMVLMSNSKEQKGKILLESKTMKSFVSAEGFLPRPIRFNKKYLIDVMDSMDADEISLNLPPKYGNPVYWKNVSSRENMDDLLLMPARVSDKEIEERR